MFDEESFLWQTSGASNEKEKTMDQCSYCKGALVWGKQDFKYPDVDWLVLSENSFGKCDTCGETEVEIKGVTLLEEWIVREVVLNRQIGPKEIKFLRIFMGAQSAWAFAVMIGTQSRVIKSWEGGVKPSTHIQQRVRKYIRHKRPDLFMGVHGQDVDGTSKVHVIFSEERGRYLRVVLPS